MDIQTKLYVTQIFDNDLIAIGKKKVTLTLNKPAYIGMCVLELSKVLMYKFHDDYIENKYGNNSRLLFRDTDSLMYEIKTEDVYTDFSSHKEMFDFSKSKSKYYDNSNELVVAQMKDETAGVVIAEFVRLKPKIYSYLVDHNSEHKKTKGINKNVVATISHNENNNVLLNKKCLRHSTYEINTISLSCFHDKIYIQSNGCNGLALRYYS